MLHIDMTTVKELRAMAKERGYAIPGASKMVKAELWTAIAKIEEEEDMASNARQRANTEPQIEATEAEMIQYVNETIAKLETEAIAPEPDAVTPGAPLPPRDRMVRIQPLSPKGAKIVETLTQVRDDLTKAADASYEANKEALEYLNKDGKDESPATYDTKVIPRAMAGTIYVEDVKIDVDADGKVTSTSDWTKMDELASRGLLGSRMEMWGGTFRTAYYLKR